VIDRHALALRHEVPTGVPSTVISPEMLVADGVA